ncbi:MAG: molybdopterin-dependent oxidoreductase [Candidatus Protistobacter heckmanni]|nr:molybdopterin-dependent oxidoreductase [Candidatus Protistobacter heckmanni]
MRRASRPAPGAQSSSRWRRACSSGRQAASAWARTRYARLAARLGLQALPVDVVDAPAEDTPTDIDGAHYAFGEAGALAQVCVDTWTGSLRVEKMAMLTALGLVASPMGYLGQMEGGALIGQSLATTEDLRMAGGRYLARNLDGYLVPTLADAPELEVCTVQNLMPGDTVGPRGAGEISMNIAVAVVANAAAEAIGMPVNMLPLTAERILDWLEQDEEEHDGSKHDGGA